MREMIEKLPYYMAYPMPDIDDGRAERLDYDYMRSLYPDTPKRLLPYVEEECDRMEYANSMVYDEYPDRLQLRLMCGRIMKNVEKYEKDMFEEDGQEEGDSCSCSGMKKDWIRDMTEILLYQELYKRRSDRRRGLAGMWSIVGKDKRTG